jgi:hypothetical protein
MEEGHWPRVFQLIEAGMAKVATGLNRRAVAAPARA